MKLLLVCFLALCLTLSTYASRYYSGGYNSGYNSGYGNRGYSSYGRSSGSRGNPLGGFITGLALGKGAVVGGLATLAVASLLFGKKKRSVESVQNDAVLEDVLNTWDYSMQTGGQCVERMFCEIAADPAAGTQGEKMTKKILANNEFLSVIMSKPGHLAADALIEAGKIGQLAKNSKLCQIMFPACGVDMKIMRSSFEQGYEEGIKVYKKY